MQFVTKKTTELSLVEKQGIVTLFNEVFERERTVEEFDLEFLNTVEGFSYHTFATDNDEIVAANTMVPAMYHIGGKLVKAVNSVDTMIAKNHRGLENFYDMAKASFNHSEQNGYEVVVGFPNDNSYELFTKLKFMKDVGRLDTYCLPYRVGGIKKSLGFLNPLSILFCRIWAGCSSLFASSKNATFSMYKDDESYNKTRYQRTKGPYGFAAICGTTCIYRIKEQDGVRTAFIVDIYQKSPKSFNKAVRYLIKNEGKNFDLILYVGHLSFSNTGLIKIPRKYEPKRFNFSATFFNKELVDKKDFYDIKNWDVNLSNYDLI